jgi:acyl-CoA hydrolase
MARAGTILRVGAIGGHWSAMKEPDETTNAIDRSSTDPMPTAAPAVRTIAMPADTKPAGDIFGGWLISQMDLAVRAMCTRPMCHSGG